MQIKVKSVDELIPYARNSRTHSEEQILQIASSIREFGFNNPVLIDQDGGIIAGHGRVLAARKIGMKEVPTIELRHLTDTQKKAYVIADNKIALNAGWDEEMLKLELEELRLADFDIDLTGFTDEEFNLLMGENVEQVQGLTEDEAVPEVTEDPVSKLGDVWVLGKHRVMCGDSTSIDSVNILMSNDKADLGFCDPPYNLGFEYNSYDDNKTDDEYIEFSRLWFSNLTLFSDRQIVTLGTKNIPIMANLDKVSGVACWIKRNWITSCHIAKLQQWEPLFFYGDFTKYKRNSDLFEINRVYQKDVGESHSCPKQIALIEDVLVHYSKSMVIDLFGGSGTTLIAGEKVGRITRLMELDPKYCDVIVKRWQDFTGKEAVLESTGLTFNSYDK